MVCIRILWSPGPLIMMKNISSNGPGVRTIFEKHTAPKTENMLWSIKHIENKLLEQGAFQIWSWIIFDFKNSFKL